MAIIYILYKAIWMAAVGEVLQCEREPSNASVSGSEEGCDDNRPLTQESIANLLTIYEEQRKDTVHSDRRKAVLC